MRRQCGRRCRRCRRRRRARLPAAAPRRCRARRPSRPSTAGAGRRTSGRSSGRSARATRWKTSSTRSCFSPRRHRGSRRRSPCRREAVRTLSTILHQASLIDRPERPHCRDTTPDHRREPLRRSPAAYRSNSIKRQTVRNPYARTARSRNGTPRSRAGDAGRAIIRVEQSRADLRFPFPERFRQAAGGAHDHGARPAGQISA